MITTFRLDPEGVVDPRFAPNLARPTGATTNIALGIRPDGRLLYGLESYDARLDTRVAVLDQRMPDGAPDTHFGANGEMAFPLDADEYSRGFDLRVLADDSVVFAVLTSKRLRVFRLDAGGLPAASFGAGGEFGYPVSNDPASFSLLTLLSLADGNFLASVAREPSAETSTPAPPSLLGIRFSANGALIRAETLLGADFQAPNLNWTLIALPDASVLIARSHRYSATGPAALFRLFPDNSIDASFGAGAAYPLPGVQSVSALALDAGGRLLVAGQDATSAVVARYDLSGRDTSAPVVEYYNTGLRHYFITAGPGEITSIETGGAGPGWQRTGFGFRAYLPEHGIPFGALPVCRFYGTPGRGPNSHFYSLSPPECITVQRDPGWTLEGTAFHLFPPLNGHCGIGQQGVYRVYNNRFAQNDSNHRYTTDPDLYAQMQAQGWLAEGIVFCAPLL